MKTMEQSMKTMVNSIKTTENTWNQWKNRWTVQMRDFSDKMQQMRDFSCKNLIKSSHKSARQNPPRRWARQRSESVDKQRRNPCGSGSEGTYPCGAQGTMWWLNGHTKMRSYQTRPFQRKNAKRSWQRMKSSWSSSRRQKQQQGSVFWSGNSFWIMLTACEGTPCISLWHLTSGQTSLESLWTRLMLTNQYTTYWKRAQTRSRSFAAWRRALDAFEATST